MKEFLEALTQGETPLSPSQVEAIDQEFQARRRIWEQQTQQALDQAQFARTVDQVIHAHKGRNITAISALLDLAALQKEADPAKAVDRAVRTLRQEHGYLFASETAAPPYSPGAGTAFGAGETNVNTLSGALKERFLK